jgi:ubiquinone/menaquinone biosynthesis C-methylase UbiE
VKIRNLFKLHVSSDRDKQLEKERYDTKAAMEHSSLATEKLSNQQSLIAALLNQPYEVYYRKITENITTNMKVLELGAGTGTHTGVLIKSGATVTALDISPLSLDVTREKFHGSVQVVCASMDEIPLPSATFDVIVSAGSLSYVDFQKVLGEIRRLLKDDGSLIVIDSLNHNLVYRTNRYLRFILKQRSYSTLIRMPTTQTIQEFRRHFAFSEVKFFGAYLWFLAPLSKLLPSTYMMNFNSFLEKNFPSGKNSFKFVLYCANYQSDGVKVKES